MIYENPPPYEFQTVALDFDHDNGGYDNQDGGKDAAQPGDTPVFNDGNKVNKTRNPARNTVNSL